MMFVRQSKYNAVLAQSVAFAGQCNEEKRKYIEMVKQWNDLVAKVNAGYYSRQTFLPAPAMEKEDVRRLLMLCHPDKHGGSKLAEEMTVKLLAMRK